MTAMAVLGSAILRGWKLLQHVLDSIGWLNRPQSPHETIQQRLGSLTLHRIMVFILGWNVASAFLIPSNGKDMPIRVFGVAFPLVVMFIHKQWNMMAAFWFWAFTGLGLSMLEILAGGGVYSGGFRTFARMILGSAIFVPSIMPIIGGTGWLIGSLGLAILQNMGLWVPSNPYPLSLIGGIAGLCGSTLNFGIRAIVIIDEFQREQQALRSQIRLLSKAHQDKERLRAEMEQLFWHFSHELRSPLARLKLQWRSVTRSLPDNSSLELKHCERTLNHLCLITDQTILLVQLQNRVSFPSDEFVDLTSFLRELSLKIQKDLLRTQSTGSATPVFRMKDQLMVHGSTELLERTFRPLLEIFIRDGSLSFNGRASGEWIQLELVGNGGDSAEYLLAEELLRGLAEIYDGSLWIERGPHRVIRINLRIRKQMQRLDSEEGVSPENKPSEESEATDSYPGKLLTQFLYFMGLWGVSWFVYHSRDVWRDDLASGWFGLVVSFCSMFIIWIKERVGVRAAFLALYIASAAISIPVLLYNGGVMNPVAYAIAVVPLSGVLIFPKRQVISALGATLAVLVSIAIFQWNDLWPSLYEVPDPFAAWLILVAGVASFALVLIPAILQLRKTSSILEQRIAQLDFVIQENQLICDRQKLLFESVTKLVSEPLKRFKESLQISQLSALAMHEEIALLQQLLQRMLHLSLTNISSQRNDQAVDVSKILRRVCRRANIEFASQRRFAELEIAGGEFSVLGDAELLNSAFGNVVRNALRFTNLDTTVQIFLGHAQDGNMQILVVDNGPGVPDEMLVRIFDPFIRLDQGCNWQSTGLGLTITRQVVCSLGGEVTAENRFGGGLAVKIVLPIIKSRLPVSDL